MNCVTDMMKLVKSFFVCTTTGKRSSFQLLASFFILVSSLQLPASAFSGEYDAEIAKHQKIISNDSTNLDAAYQLGNLLAWDGRYDEAIVVYGRILAKEPGYEDADIGIARAYAWQGAQETAIQKYEEILQKNPKNFEAWQGLGGLALWVNDFEKSIDYFKKALVFNPEDIVSLKGIGRAYLGRGDRRRAEEFFTKAQILEIKNTPLPLIVASVAGGLLFLFILFQLIRSYIRKRKKELLRMELKALRYALAFYQQKTGKCPLALENLLDEKWRQPGTTEDRPLLEGARRGERGFLVDPFGRKYWYNPDTGGIYSTTKGCEKW